MGGSADSCKFFHCVSDWSSISTPTIGLSHLTPNDVAHINQAWVDGHGCLQDDCEALEHYGVHMAAIGIDAPCRQSYLHIEIL